MKAMGVFLLFGALMASLAGATLVWRGTALDRMWALNPRAFKELAPHGKIVGVPFLLLGAALAATGIGWLKHRLWGWRLAVVIIATQVLEDLFNVIQGQVVQGVAGITIACTLLFYMTRPSVLATFVVKPKQIVSTDGPGEHF
jgi:hypothetical protein